MSTNFKVFDENKINLLADAAYLESVWRTNGNQPGIAPGDVYNKLFYQTSIFCAAFAKSLSDRGLTVSDDDFAALVNVFSQVALQTNQTAEHLYTTAGSYSLVIPSWSNHAIVSGCAGGGGGNASHGLGGGGGMCAYEQLINVTPEATLSLVVGVGGAASATTHNSNPATYPGVSGTNTTITESIEGLLLTLVGGKGGGTGSGQLPYYGGLAGGWGATNGGLKSIFNVANSPSPQFMGGRGGSTLFGTGGHGGYYAGSYLGYTARDGEAGAGFGSGGGGGGESGGTYWCAAGKGADGMLKITFKA